MKILSKLKNKALLKRDEFIFGLKLHKYALDLPLIDLIKIFNNRNELYRYMHHYHLHSTPENIVEHRNYFKQEQRGFGEDALHSMWIKIFSAYKPKLALEIGVYRGQIITLWGLICRMQNFECEIHGISPFSPANDTVSEYLQDLDYYQDVLNSFNNFNLTPATLITAFSNDPIGIAYIKSKNWDLIYIDGNHDYEVVFNDYKISKDALSLGGILVLDDSSLYTEFNPPKFAFAGHPGPSRIVRDFAMKEMKFIGGVGHNNIFMKY